MKEMDLQKQLPRPGHLGPREDEADMFGADAPDTVLDNPTPAKPDQPVPDKSDHKPEE